MPPWLLVWLFRFARGERWRKSTPGDKRIGAGMFLLVAMVFIAVELTNHFDHDRTGFLDTASPLKLWMAMTAFIIVILLGLLFWVQKVSARLSTILAIIAWAVLLALIAYFEWL